MANDPVKAARQRLKERVIDRIIATTRTVPTLDELIDALIAAVRAENAQEERLRCSRCGKSVSTPFLPVPTDTPDRGLIIRAWVECPECMEAAAKK